MRCISRTNNSARPYKSVLGNSGFAPIRSPTEQCKAFLLDDYVLATPKRSRSRS
jgi:hypothetical protein